MAKRKSKHIDENDFEALDKLARNIRFEDTRPLSPKMRREWELAKRAGRGRPKKPQSAKAVPTLITVEPSLLKKIDAYTKKKGISRSRLFAQAVKARLGLPG
jgi:hypothetical protein